MKGTRIVWPQPGRAELEEYEVAAPAAGQVLIRTDYTVVSAGTERAWLSAMPNTSGAFPAYPGYSASGHVIEVGPGVTEFKPHDRVVAYHSPHCSHSVKHIIDVVKIDDDATPAEQAAFVIIAGMSLHGVRRAGIELGESVLVVGLGLLGLFAVQLAAIDGALPVIGVDFNSDRRRLAASLGADGTLDPAAPDFEQSFGSLVGGSGAAAVIEVTGAPPAMNLAFRCVARRGRIVALGCTRHPVDGVDFYRDIHHPGVSVIGAHNMVRPRFDTSPGCWTMRDDMRVLLRMISAGRLKVAPMISQIVAPADAPAVYQRLLEANDFPLGVVFDWRAAG